MYKKIVISIFVMFLIGIFIWLNRYKYDYFKSGDRSIPIRTNRFTGKAEKFHIREGWIKVFHHNEKQRQKPKGKYLHPNLKEITGECWIIEDSKNLQCDIYNGSWYDLEVVSIKLNIMNSYGELDFSRKYHFEPSYTIKSYETYSFDTNLDFRLKEKQKWEWFIVNVGLKDDGFRGISYKLYSWSKQDEEQKKLIDKVARKYKTSIEEFSKRIAKRWMVIKSEKKLREELRKSKPKLTGKEIDIVIESAKKYLPPKKK